MEQPRSAWRHEFTRVGNSYEKSFFGVLRTHLGHVNLSELSKQDAQNLGVAVTTSKIYTRSGDKGTTSLVTGDRVSKSDLRLEVYGTVDELNSCVGVLIAFLETSQIPAAAFAAMKSALTHVQNQLFNVGSQLACNDKKIAEKLPQIESAHIQALENEMDRMSNQLTELKNFILPGGSHPGAYAHIARTVCRRAERMCCKLAEEQEVPELIIPYLNRLNDYFFVLARYINSELKVKDVVWEK